MKTGRPRMPQNEFEKEKITNRSQQRATDKENLDRCLRALTLQQRNIFMQNFMRCPKNKERKEMVNQLLERFGIQTRPIQPKSKSKSATDVNMENVDRCLKALTLQQRHVFTQNYQRCPRTEKREMVNQLLERFNIKKLETTQPTSPNKKKRQAHEHQIKMIENYVAPPPSTPKATKVKFRPPELQTFNKEDSVKKMGTIWQLDKREKAKDEASQRATATIPPINRAGEQSKWKEEKGDEKNEPTKRFPATFLSSILSNEFLTTSLLDKLKSSDYKLSATPRQRKIAATVTEYLEAHEARRKRSTNKNQHQSNHGTSNLPRRQELLDLTGAERLRTREFEWTIVKRGTKMEAAQRPTTSTMQTFIVAQTNSAQTDASPTTKPAKKKKVQQKADEAPSQGVQRRQAIQKENTRILIEKTREKELKRKAFLRKQEQQGPNYQRYYYMLKQHAVKLKKYADHPRLQNPPAKRLTDDERIAAKKRRKKIADVVKRRKQEGTKRAAAAFLVFAAAAAATTAAQQEKSTP